MKFCPVCNAQCEDNSLYCANCGCSLNATPVTPASQPVQPQTQAPAPQEPVQQPIYTAPPQQPPVQPQYPQAPVYNAPQQPPYQAPVYQAPQYQQPAPQQQVPQQQAPVYGNVPPVPPQNGYYPPAAPQSPKKGKGLIIGLFVGIGVLLLAIIIIAFVAVSGILSNVTTGGEIIESSTVVESEEEVSEDEPIEESSEEPSQVVEESALPTSPHDFDLEVENPFLKLENGAYQVTVEDVFWNNSGLNPSDIESTMETMGITLEISGDDVIFHIPEDVFTQYEEFFGVVFDTVIEGALTGGEYPALVDISPNASFSVIDLTIDRSVSTYEDDEFGAAYYMATIGSLHQMFHGVPSDLTMVTINYIDADTGELYDSTEIIDPTQILE